MIDSHVHLGSLPVKGNFKGSWEDYKRIAKIANIKKYCVIPIGLPNHFTDKTTPNNEEILQEAKKDKAVIPVYWFNVFDLPEKIDSSYKAVKFHPDIGEVAIDDERVIGFVNKIKLPVFVHTNEGKEYSTLEKVINLSKRVEVPVIAIHSGSITRTLFKLPGYNFPDNVYFETSGIQYAAILKEIYQKVGAKRIILGSDYPFGDVRVSLALIKSLDASKAEEKMMTHKNLEKLLK